MPTDPSQEIIVGMGGWDLPPFDGRFYPAEREKGFRKLAYYARFFDAVEVNVTFYNTALSPAQARRWLQDVSANARFRFTVKLFRGFTHTFDATQRDATAFRRLLEPLRDAGRLGGVVIQFPGSFARTNDRLQYLGKLGETFGDDPIFVELRHRSWDDPGVWEVLASRQMCPVNTDLPALRSHIPFANRAVAGRAYFRMMGRNVETWNHPEKGDRYLYRYSDAELRDLLARIRSVPAPSTFVVFHNDPQANSPVNGFQFRHLVDPAKKLIIPAPLIRLSPELVDIGTPAASEDSLFQQPL